MSASEDTTDTTGAPATAGPTGVFAMIRATPPSARYLFGGVFVNQMGAFVQTFLVLYLTFKGLSLGKAGATLTAYSVGAVVGMLLGGEYTHRFGPRATIATAMFSSALLVGSLPLLSGHGRFGGLLVVVALAGMVSQAYRPAASVLLTEIMPEEHRVMSFSMLRIAMNVGAAIAPLIAAGLILIDWNLLFWVDAFTALVYSAFAVFFLPRRTVPAPGSVAGAVPSGAVPAESVPAGSVAVAADKRSAYSIMARDTSFLLYLASMLLSAAVYIQYTVALPIKITAEHHPAALYSVALAISSIILVTCELKITSYVRHWRPNVAGALGTAVFGLGLAAYGLSRHSSALILVSTVIFVSGVMISGPTMWAYPAKAPAALRARYAGASQSVFGVGLALGPVLGVFAWTRFGNGVFLLCGIVNLIAAACAFVGMRRDPGLPAASAVEEPATASVTG